MAFGIKGQFFCSHPDFRHGLHTANAFVQEMDVDFPNAQTNIELDSGGDWPMDGYLPLLNDVHIAVLNKCLLVTHSNAGSKKKWCLWARKGIPGPGGFSEA
jgi:hypothetical protein